MVTKREFKYTLPPTFRSNQMSDLSETIPTTTASNMTSMLENFNTTSSSAQNFMNASNLSSSQKVLNSKSTSTTSHTAKTRIVTQSSTSSSSSSSKQFENCKLKLTETKADALKRDLSEIKSSMNEINNIANLSQNPMNSLKEKIRKSFENLVDCTDTEGIVTHPDDLQQNNLELDIPSTMSIVPGELTNGQGICSNLSSADTVKYEERSTKSQSKTKIETNGIRSEKATANSQATKKLKTNDLEYEEANAMAAVRNRIEADGVKAEQNAALIQDSRSLKTSDVHIKDSSNIAATNSKFQSDLYSTEKTAMSQQQQSQTVTTSGLSKKEQHFAQHSSQYRAFSSQKTSSLNSQTLNGSNIFDDLEKLCGSSKTEDVDGVIMKYTDHVTNNIKTLSKNDSGNKSSNILDNINEIVKRAWSVPTHGHELGVNLCNTLRQSGGLDLLMKNCMGDDRDLQFSSARLLEQCLTTENRSHVVENGLEKVVNVACVCTRNSKTDHSRVGTGILEHLFKHSEGTCSDVIKLGGLDAVLFECRKNDVETLRHCASALANLSLYGGAENQEAMINRKVPMWLFPLAFHDDDNIKYYACLAIAVLVANKEIEAEVLKSGTLDLVEPFVTSHNPYEFAKSNLAHAHGQSKHWLERLVPVLSSKREEAAALASFHFCMEAGIKKQQGNTNIFREIGAIEPLKKVASCPNAIASKFAAQALRLIGETVPHKLSQQVPLWSTEDVREWVKQIGFTEYEQSFYDSRVDGDLLLQLTEENLSNDIGITNGIRRKRFARELQNLKKMADYSSRDTTNLNNFLLNIGPEYSIYTYSMLNAGVDKESIKTLNEDQLIVDCGITNSIHRDRILNVIKRMETSLSLSSDDICDLKTLDVFVSYRRSNGSQLASLLKVHLQLRGFTVFIDVERLEAGKFDNNLLQSIKQAKHFLLVLTPRALERCLEDAEGKDWVHREIVAALNSNCNIIPIIDNFTWPEPEELPEDMRSVCHFNGVRWIHDYQDACVDKLERFMRGELNIRNDGYRAVGRALDSTAPSTPGTASSTRQNPPVYQRMHSNDSGKGSEKDANGTSRMAD